MSPRPGQTKLERERFEGLFPAKKIANQEKREGGSLKRISTRHIHALVGVEQKPVTRPATRRAGSRPSESRGRGVEAVENRGEPILVRNCDRAGPSVQAPRQRLKIGWISMGHGRNAPMVPVGRHATPRAGLPRASRRRPTPPPYLAIRPG